jgi:predicted component of type VI protein secretion system
VFSRAFSSGVQPVEIARKLAKEMDAHKTASVQRVYVPNEYTVWLCPDDYERFKDYESSLAQELSGHLLEHARHHDYDLLTRPVVHLDEDDRLRLGEFGIQTRLVRPPQRQGAEPTQGGHGHTMVYSAAEAQKAKSKRRPDAAYSETRAIVALDDRRYVLDGPTATLGRSKECDCIIDDPNVSRKHAELRRSDVGDWQVVDLGSTNGVKVNGRRVANARLSPGDEITLGTKVFSFDIEQ